MTQGTHVTTLMVKDVNDAETINDYLGGKFGPLAPKTKLLLERRLRLIEAMPAWPPSTPILNIWLFVVERLLEILRDSPGITPGLPQK